MSEKVSRANSATLKFLRVSPRKARVVIDMIRDQPLDVALDALHHCDKGVAKPISKLLSSAAENASSQLDWDVDSLYVSRAWVDEGPTMRRFRPRAMGRASRIRKRTSHITIELGEF